MRACAVATVSAAAAAVQQSGHRQQQGWLQLLHEQYHQPPVQQLEQEHERQ